MVIIESGGRNSHPLSQLVKSNVVVAHEEHFFKLDCLLLNVGVSCTLLARV